MNHFSWHLYLKFWYQFWSTISTTQYVSDSLFIWLLLVSCLSTGSRSPARFMAAHSRWHRMAVTRQSSSSSCRSTRMSMRREDVMASAGIGWWSRSSRSAAPGEGHGHRCAGRRVRQRAPGGISCWSHSSRLAAPGEGRGRQCAGRMFALQAASAGGHATVIRLHEVAGVNA